MNQPQQRLRLVSNAVTPARVDFAEAQKRIQEFAEECSRASRDRAMASALMQMGKISADKVDEIKEEQTRHGDKNFAVTAARLGLVKQADVRHALAVSHGLVRQGSTSAAVPRELVLLRAPNSKDAETFRAARTELLTRYDRDRTQCLAIASIEKSRPADFAAINLAASFALLKRRTLLIDADLRQNRLGRAFRMGEPTGLVDVLCQRATPSEACLETTIENLWLMPVGRPTPDAQELLAQHNFDALIAQMSAAYHNVVVVSAPYGPTADGHYVWKACTGAVAVVRQHKERSHQLMGLQRALRSVDAETVGAMMVR